MTGAPNLVIFDIDTTLLKPNVYQTIDQVSQGLYDKQLLTPFLDNPKYQVAIASYNHDVNPQYLGGRRLGRAILDLQHPTGSSHHDVEDEFIQAWMLSSLQLVNQHGKNEHISRILDAYRKKYGTVNPMVLLYDDRIENVYLAGKNGIRAYWVTNGLTRENIHTYSQIGNRVQFSIVKGDISQCVSKLDIFAQYVYKHPHAQNTTPLYSIYLPPHPESAHEVFMEFLRRLQGCGIVIQLIHSDITVS